MHSTNTEHACVCECDVLAKITVFSALKLRLPPDAIVTEYVHMKSLSEHHPISPATHLSLHFNFYLAFI